MDSSEKIQDEAEAVMENAAARATDRNPVRALCMGCMEPDAGYPVCPRCGWERNSTARSVLHLPPGAILQNYMLGRVLGQGGFGITYIGWDTQLERKVAVKEYFPQMIASRAPGSATVAPSGARVEGDFAHGLESFMQEGRILARFSDHPCIVSVLNLFEANHTGYLVMGYLEGATLSQALASAGGKLPYAAAREIMLRVMDGLREVHAQGLLHRDISPDNIYLTRQGPVKILDFGAARMAVGERSQSLSVVLKEGYAPEEQHRREGKQGPWTDVYAAGATFYKIITGITPPSALDRSISDRLAKPSAYCPDLPPQAEAAILKAMAVKAEGRYRAIEPLQRDLPAVEPPVDPGPGPSPVRRDWKRPAIAVAAICAALLLGYWLVRKVMNGHYESAGETAYRAHDFSTARTDFEKAADAGNVAAEMFLGRMYAQGEGVTKNLDRARQMYEKAAAGGNAEAMDNLGFLYENGWGVTQNYGAAADWYRQASAAGSADATGRLGLLYYNGWGVTRDYAEARKLFERAAAGGSARAVGNLALIYQHGLGVQQDIPQAERLYQKSAELGSAASLAFLGQLYENGTGVAKDPATARQYYEKAAAGGDPWAMVYLGEMARVSGDPLTRRRWLDKASAVVVPGAVDPLIGERRTMSGRGAALRGIGDIYRYPAAGLTPQYVEAAQYYQRAADDGDAVAMDRLGEFYYHGDGGATDYARARQLYEKAIALGNAAAMCDLGVLYLKGLGGLPKSPEMARQWYEKSAAGGNVTAMQNLGDMYMNGIGIPADTAKGREWWGKAADGGNVEAMIRLAQSLVSEISDHVNRTKPAFWPILDKINAGNDLDRARQLLEKASAAGDSRAAALIAKVDALLPQVHVSWVPLKPFGR